MPCVAEHKVGVAITAVIVLTALNLRGLRESGTLFAIPTYGFMIVIIGMLLTGLFRIFVLGEDLRAPSAGLEIAPRSTSLTGFALVFLLLRTFSSGCAALTGVEAISNGVPAFKPPKSRNAATTLLLLGVVAVIDADRHHLAGPADQPAVRRGPGAADRVGAGRLRAEDRHHPARPRRSSATARSCCYVVAGATALILFLAANTAFNGFPVLGSILAQDRYLPRQLHTRGDRLAFSNGIIFLAVFAMRADRARSRPRSPG